MINTSVNKKEHTVQSGVVDYPIGFPFYFNPDRTPQLLVKIGDEELRYNHNFELSEDKGSVVLRPTEEESWTLEGPEDFSWMTKWDGKYLLIERAVPFVQESDYQLGRISSEQIERDFDLSVMRDQILADKIGEHTDDVRVEIDALHSRIDFVQEEHLLDMAAVDKEMATKATKTELENAKTVLGEGIQGNADAIQKTREDYIAADSEIHQILNNHADELTTLRGNQASLGDQVSGIEEKIPESASGTNPLITKQQLLDEEMDIRDDLNEMASELQTQITAQAAEIAKKQDELIAGDNITIVDNVISATGGGGASGDYLPLSGGTITGAINYNAGELTSYLWKDKPLFTTTFTDVGGYYTFEEAGLYASANGLCIGYKNSSSPMLTFMFRSNKIEPEHKAVHLGTQSNVFASVATKKIVSGIDTSDYSINEIIVPEKKGTMARIEDIDAIGGYGTTGQVLTKTDTGMAWRDATGGGSIPDTSDFATKGQLDDLRTHVDLSDQANIAALNATASAFEEQIAEKQDALGFVPENAANKVNDIADVVDRENQYPTVDYLDTMIQEQASQFVDALEQKQDVLTAGENITISNNVISAKGGASLPDQSGNAGKVLTTDGTTTSWQDAPASGTKVIIKRY